MIMSCSTPSATAPPPSAPPTPTGLTPPVAAVRPTELEQSGQVRVDNYYWLRERETPEVMDYLNAENAYTDGVMAPLEPLETKIFEEIKNRIKQDDATVPYRLKDYFYYTRFEEGKQYPIHCRKKGSLTAAEEVMVDVNALAEGHEFFRLRQYGVSPNQDLLAYPFDDKGRRIFTIRIKNLTTGELLPDEIPQVTGNMAWADDNQTLFYSKQDPTTLRWDRVYRHKLGTDVNSDVLVYEEKDETFSIYLTKTKSRKYIIIAAKQTLSTEMRYLDAATPTGEFQIFLPREEKHEYTIDHLGDHFYIRTNYLAQNFRLMKTPVGKTDKANWQDLIPHREDVLVESAELFDDYLVVSERQAGLIRMRIKPWSGGEEHYLDFGEPAYVAYFGDNLQADTTTLRFEYASMTTPDSVYDYDMKTRQKTLLKREEVLGGFDQTQYVTERLHAPAADGAKVPISLVYRKGLVRDGSNPLLLYGYGSYGYTVDADFSSSRLSLLDRGFVYAIAHVRGSETLGRQWYEDGKLLKKKNTFTDFIACGEYLVKEKFTAPDRLFARGGSAGGLLMGAVVNMRPDLFNGVIADVPFVDVVTTMLDDSIPLTTSEFDEWGHPKIKEYYDYLLSFSPYDNVEAKDYPNLLVITGLHDSQVQYWEPAKWVAKLRAMKTDDNLLLFKTYMAAGHGGKSGRFNRYKSQAFWYAFLLKLSGITE